MKIAMSPANPVRNFSQWIPVLVVAIVISSECAAAADNDLQLWSPMQFIYPVGQTWDISMQVEPRLQENISEFSQLVYKPAINYHFNSTWAISTGYKYIDKYHESNEQDIWQECHYNKKYGDLVTGLQVRLEERFIDDIEGVIPRLRFLVHASHPLGESSSYVTGFGAIRFNLDDKHAGPVSDFEQSRIFAGLGRHIGNRLQVEAGYLWRYERERIGADLSDHVIHFQMVFNTRAKKIQKPSSRDRYR
jgi:hypothetical protein